MVNKEYRPEQAVQLRRRAEEKAGPLEPAALSPEETWQTLHELQVHQIELEMQNEELRMVKQDDTAFWERLEANAAQDADGAPVCRIVLSDITERKQAEMQIHEQLEELRRWHAITLGCEDRIHEI